MAMPLAVFSQRNRVQKKQEKRTDPKAQWFRVPKAAHFDFSVLSSLAEGR